MSNRTENRSRPDYPVADGAWAVARAAKRLLSPGQRFLSVEAASGIMLLAAALVALVWANSPLRSSYEWVLHAPIGLRLGGLRFERDVHFWINDGLMVVFFFVVGLEIKRELRVGELSTLRRAALPAFAAVGGMIVPAAIYLLFNSGTAQVRGWGVPMATDIAFAVGVLALLGKRVPPALRILLLALAVIDDLGAIVVIAAFYSAGVNLSGAAVAGGAVLLIILMRKLGVRSPWAYVLPALVLWAGTYASGIHPTIAGVLCGLLTPVRPTQQPPCPSKTIPSSPAPAERLQHALHGWVAFGIMPLFALANAGVPLEGAHLDGGGARVLLGIALGLVLGKPIGVMALAWVAVRARMAALPPDVGWSGVLVVALVAGIGFTMALFIASLAFAPGPRLEIAKVGILSASTLAAVFGAAVGRVLLRAVASVETARTAEKRQASARS